MAVRPWRGEGRLHKIILGGGGLCQVWGEIELFGGGGEASPAPPSLDETLTGYQRYQVFENVCNIIKMDAK